MIQNTFITNRTGRKIQFSWQQVLGMSKLFLQSPDDPCVWELYGLASVCVIDAYIAMHPGKPEIVSRVMDILSTVISKCYHCQATLDSSRWPNSSAIMPTTPWKRF